MSAESLYIQIEGVGYAAGASWAQYRFSQTLGSEPQYRRGMVVGAAVESTWDPVTYEVRQSDQVIYLPLRDAVVRDQFTRTWQTRKDLAAEAMAADSTDTSTAVGDHTLWAVDDLFFRGREAMRVKTVGSSPIGVDRAVLGTRLQEHFDDRDIEVFEFNQILKGRRIECKDYATHATKWAGVIANVKVEAGLDRVRVTAVTAGRWLERKIGHGAYAGVAAISFGDPAQITVAGETLKAPLLEEMGVTDGSTATDFAVLEDEGEHLYTALRWGSNTTGQVLAFIEGRLDGEPVDAALGTKFAEVLTARAGAAYNPFRRFDVDAAALETTPTTHPVDIFLMIALSGLGGQNYTGSPTYHYDTLKHWGCGIPYQCVDIDAWEDVRDIELAGLRADRVIIRRGQALEQVVRLLRAVGVAIVINGEGQIAPLYLHDQSTSATSVAQADFRPTPEWDRRLGATLERASIDWGDEINETEILDLRARLWYPEQDADSMTIDASDYSYSSSAERGRVLAAAEAQVARYLWRPPVVAGDLDPSIEVGVGDYVSVTHANLPAGDGTIGVAAKQMLVISCRHDLAGARSRSVTLMYLAHYLRTNLISHVAEVVTYDSATRTATVVENKFATAGEDDNTGLVSDRVFVASQNGEILSSNHIEVDSITATTVVFKVGYAPTNDPRQGDLIVHCDADDETFDDVCYFADSDGDITYDSGADTGYQYGE